MFELQLQSKSYKFTKRDYIRLSTSNQRRMKNKLNKTAFGGLNTPVRKLHKKYKSLSLGKRCFIAFALLRNFLSTLRALA